jgi:diguanylate cyclase (GGDEF)-like protein
LAVQHEQDLVASARAFYRGDRDPSNAEFVAWAGAEQALARYPELLGIGLAVMVPAWQLPGFEARALADPVGTASPDRRLHIIPAGDRPFYCLAVSGLSRAADSAAVAGTDICALSPDILASRDTGEGVYLPVVTGTAPLLGIYVPIYRGDVVPTTVAVRRTAFHGWIAMVVFPNVLLDQARQGQPDTSVTFSYRQGQTDVSFHAGPTIDGGMSSAIDMHNGWTVTTRAIAPSDSITANGSAFALLLAGIGVSLLLATLMWVLGTGRERALNLVSERTGELRHQALHDALTGLPNRALIMDRTEQLLARNRRHGTTGGVLFVDLDEFKNVNDTLGHAAGDQLLVAVATRLMATLRDTDTIGRMGGDEFVILVDGGQLSASPELVAERLLDVLHQPFEVTGASLPIVVNASIGIATGDRETAGELLRDADVALYQAKAAGKNRYEVFYPLMHTEISRQIELEFDLRSALEGDQFRLMYQPIYNLDDLTLIGVEALLRWDHPELGLVQPDEFIPLLEQSGQIREVGRWVLRQACNQTADWHARGNPLDVSVNVSGRQLDSDHIIDHIREALHQSGLDPASLIVEVTETALMRNASATATRLTAIRALGVRIAVDDFGTGYSSLAYLQQFPVDCLKIDRAFTSAISTSPESRALISTLVQLGKDLGLRTLAEGVETPAQLEHLRSQNVSQAQGFLLGRPLEPHILETHVLDHLPTPTLLATPTESAAIRLLVTDRHS